MSTLLGVKAPIPERKVMVSDSEGFVVRGLSPFQVVALYRRHTGELEPMYKRLLADGDQNAGGLEAAVLALAGDAPAILAELVVLGSGGDPSVDTFTHKFAADGSVVTLEPGDVAGIAGVVALSTFDAATHIAMQLPFPTQIDALQKIGELTFTSDMPPGKFLALVTSLLQKVTSAMSNLRP